MPRRSKPPSRVCPSFPEPTPTKNKEQHSCPTTLHRMRLITHNSLRCNRKDVTLGYPLGLEINQMEIEETDINLDFMRHLIPGLYWPGVVLAAKAVGFEGLPDSFSAEILDDEGVLQVLHRLLFDTHIIEGTLICPESGQRFPISDGIPNMMLPEALV